MTHDYHVSGMTCSGCVATVQRALSGVQGITHVDVSLPDTATITMMEHVPTVQLQKALENYSYRLSEAGHSAPKQSNDFWSDKSIWRRASVNTFNCLVGCSIGDFAMIIFLQKFYPGTAMTIQMVLATIAGLVTSISLETFLLHTREKFAWKFAFQTALSMSFISMVAMELVMNATDFMITGGKAAFGNPMYWTALIIAMIAGFLAPLPYNYYKLKKYNLACH